MPPKGKRLDETQVAALKRWIENGAHLPPEKSTDAPLIATKARVITDADRAFWSFQPPQHSQRALSDPWIRQPLDRPVLARIRERGLEPAARAHDADQRRVEDDQSRHEEERCRDRRR
jgi:hypothetical protein